MPKFTIQFQWPVIINTKSPTECHTCGDGFLTELGVKRHMASKHGYRGVTRDLYTYTNGARKSKNPRATPTKKRARACSICANGKTYKYLKAHIKYVHGK